MAAAVTLKWVIAGSILGAESYPPFRAPIPTTLAVVSALVWVMLSIRGPRRRYLVLALDCVISALLLIDIWYARFYGEVPTIADVPQLANLRFVAGSLLAQVRWVDLVAVADLVPLAWMARRTAPSRPLRRGVRRLVAAAMVVCTLPALLIIRVDPDDVFGSRFQRSEIVGALGLPGYHLFDVAAFVRYPVAGRLRAGQAELHRLERGIRELRGQELASPFPAAAGGRNLILVSAESLQAFALHATIDGVTLTPHLNAFAAESLEFTDVYDQTHLGTTAESEFMALASRLPLQSGVVATRYAANRFHALPHILGAAGYDTLSAVGEPGSFWNMRQMHRALGFRQSFFLPDFDPGEWVGVGLNDVDFFDQVARMLEERPEPFMAYMLTSSNHHPYTLPDRLKDRRITVGAGTPAHDYLQSVAYFDRAFGRFVSDLRRTGLLDRSVVVVYGDHQAWLEDDDLRRLHQELRGRAPTTLDLWRFRRRIPLLVRLPGAAAAGPRDVPGGLLDLAPTVLSLLGLDARREPVLGHDLTAPAHRLVALRDGSFTDGRTFRLTDGKAEASCFTADARLLDCSLLAPLRRAAGQLFSLSDDIVAGNLGRPLSRRLREPTPETLSPGRVDVIAHRGLSLEYPENTLPAILAARDAGADVIEIDIQLSKDGVPVVFHDDTLERTSNGTGPVASRTVRDLKRLDAGRWKGPQHAGTSIPTLQEVLDATGGTIPLLLDLKADGMGAAVARVYAQAGVPAGMAMIGGWNGRQRADFARHMPDARILRTEPAPAVWGSQLDGELRDQRVWGFELGDAWPASFVAEARLKGWPVIAYTVNDEATMRRLIEMGVTAIETDDPALLLRLRGEMRR